MLGTPALIRTLLVTLLLAAGTAVSAQRFQVKLGGKVTDYFHTGWWPTFNLADTYLTCGVALLIAATASRHAR